MTLGTRAFSLVFALLVSGLVAGAQEPITLPVNPMQIEFMSSPVAFDTDPVVGAPYSAEAVTEIVQTLADGNRIVRESRAQVSRDGKGRTRRDEGLAMFGPVVGGPNRNEMRHVQIADPENRTTITLDLRNKVAHKMKMPQISFAGGISADAVSVRRFEMAVPPPPPPPPPPPGATGPDTGVRFFRREIVMGDNPEMKPVVENLGSQFIEGVQAEGTRSTMTIPAGQIGNEQPIKVVSERWFSPDLKVLVMSKQSDPRYGDTTYRLTNITRGEPSPELFEIPSDFKVVEPNKNGDVMFERKIVK